MLKKIVNKKLECSTPRLVSAFEVAKYRLAADKSRSLNTEHAGKVIRNGS